MGCKNSKTLEQTGGRKSGQAQQGFGGNQQQPGTTQHQMQPEYEDEEEYYDDEDGPPPLTEAEIKSRIINGSGSMYLPNYNYTLKYGWQSQRGYYPETPNKANQDACLIVKNFAKNQNIGYFGVYDGHGGFGDKCSGFVRSKISTLLMHNIRKTSIDDPSFDKKYGRAHEECNSQMHNCQQFDDQSSGTTAISVWIEGTKVKVANLGDSRAICAQRQTDGRLKAIALSQDQTPYRKDERERCKLTGARIMTMDQLEGLAPMHEDWGINLGEEIDDGGDPPRIWAPNGRYPGTAFTRSIGDALAETLGVYATPEILTFDMDSSHEFLVIASDGVWEFLTSQSVVDMVSQYTDPSEACRVVVAESYTLWLRHEVRTDDITMIVIQIKGLKKDDAGGTGVVGERDQNRNSIVQRPVRRRRKRDVVASGDGEEKNIYASEDAEEYDITANTVEKTPAQIARLAAAVKSNFLFVHLDEIQSKNIFSVMQRLEVKSGDTIIRQGEDGDKFYVVDSGQFDVFVSMNGAQPVQVLTYSNQGSFGELSLMYGKPRAATIKASSNGILWSLDRRAFRRLVMKSSSKSLMGTLRSVEIFKSLKQSQLVSLSDALSEVKFKSGQNVITQGEAGEKFFVIQKGTVKCTVDPGDGGKIKEVLRLGPGSYFGERALLSNKPRAASVQAVSSLVCLQISRQMFEDILGPLSTLIEDDQKRRESKGRKVTRKASIQTKGALVNDIANSTHFDYSFVGTWSISGDFSNDVSVVRHARGKEFNMRRFNKCTVNNLSLGNACVRAKNIMASASNETSNRCITDLLATYVDENCLWMLLGGSHPPMTMLLNELLNVADGGQVLSEDSAKFYVGCMASALNSLHSRNVLYRMVDSQSIGVDSSGYLVLYDFMLAKDLTQDSRTTTLCGSKEYFAPEQVSSSDGHSLPVDMWALGIFLYELLSGSTPFFSDDMKDGGETGMYDRIIGHAAGSLSLQSASKDCNAFVNKLVVPNEKKRLSASKLVTHSFFKGFDFDALQQGTLPAPHADVVQKQMEALYSGKSGGGAGGKSKRGDKTKVTTVPYMGDGEWFEGF